MILARNPDRILVVDVEATCRQGGPPPDQTIKINEKCRP